MGSSHYGKWAPPVLSKHQIGAVGLCRVRGNHVASPKARKTSVRYKLQAWWDSPDLMGYWFLGWVMGCSVSRHFAPNLWDISISDCLYPSLSITFQLGWFYKLMKASPSIEWICKFHIWKDSTLNLSDRPVLQSSAPEVLSCPGVIAVITKMWPFKGWKCRNLRNLAALPQAFLDRRYQCLSKWKSRERIRAEEVANSCTGFFVAATI